MDRYKFHLHQYLMFQYLYESIGFYLAIYPRSGLGFKYQLHLANTVGIIDADYSSSDNEGHMWIKLVNGGNKELTILPGEAIAQGIIQTFCLTDDDNTDGIRNGGFGSTSK